MEKPVSAGLMGPCTAAQYSILCPLLTVNGSRLFALALMKQEGDERPSLISTSLHNKSD